MDGYSFDCILLILGQKINQQESLVSFDVIILPYFSKSPLRMLVLPYACKLALEWTQTKEAKIFNWVKVR